MQVSFTVLAIGLSNAGKTTILRSMANRTQQIYPTAGFEISYISTGVKSVLVYDCSGEGHSRETWSMMEQNCDAVMFVIDAQDANRFSVAKQTLNRFIDKHKSLKKKCLCIMFNKSDTQNRVPKDILYKGLDVDKIQKQVGKVYVKETSAYTKDGLDECFDWMSKNVHTST